MEKEKEKKEFDLGDLLGGTLNLFGLKVDLGTLLTSPEELKEGLETLRERLEAAGGKATTSAEEWRRGGATITGHIRTRGGLGEREFHIGTMGKPGAKAAGPPQPPEVAEPPVDVFDEAEQVTIVADVPGVALEELELKVEGSRFSLATRKGARRSYRKELPFDGELDPASLQATCRNGVLEVRIRKRGAGKGS